MRFGPRVGARAVHSLVSPTTTAMGDLPPLRRAPRRPRRREPGTHHTTAASLPPPSNNGVGAVRQGGHFSLVVFGFRPRRCIVRVHFNLSVFRCRVHFAHQLGCVCVVMFGVGIASLQCTPVSVKIATMCAAARPSTSLLEAVQKLLFAVQRSEEHTSELQSR